MPRQTPPFRADMVGSLLRTAPLKAAREQYRNDPETLEISVDTKAKVNEGDYSRGGKR